MEPNAPLDYALFQLSPRRSRCELVVSGSGRTEKIASGSVKPFVTHLRTVEEQAAAQPPQPAIRLQLERRATWFSKGTLERFVRFVSTPEVLEMANGFEAEMSQLEGARKIYAAQGGASSGGDAEASAAADITKKELLRAIDVRLSALKQDLVTSCARASSAGFNHDSVSELLLFADHFGANRLSEACNKYMSLCQRRPDINPQHVSQAASSHWKSFEDGNLRGSGSSDMSIDEPQADHGGSSNKSICAASVLHMDRFSSSQQSVDVPPGSSTDHHSNSTIQQPEDKQEKETDVPPAPAKELQRRLSVQDRISMFENKQKEQTSTSGNSNSAVTAKVVPGKGEHRRVPSIASMDKLVLRRWSSVSDMSIDLSQNDNGGFNDKSENGTPAGTPTSANQEANSSKVRTDKDASGAKHPVTSQSWSFQKDGDTPKDPTTTNDCSSSTFNTTSPSSLSAVVTEAPKKQTKSCSEDDMAITSSTESESSFDKEQGVNKRQDNSRISEHVASNVSTRTRLETSPRTAEEALPRHCDTITSPSLEEHAQMIDMEITSAAHDVPVTSEQVGQKGNRGSRLRSKEIHAEAVAVGRNDRSSRTVGKVSSGVGPKSKATSNSRTNLRGSSGRDGAPSTETEGHDAGLRRKSLPRKVEDARRKVAVGSEILPLSDYSGRQGTNLSRQSSNAEQELSLLGGKVESINDGNAVPLEQPRVTRPAKGNQDRHDELQMKANELEKLFAAHKLTTTRRGKSTDAQVDDTPRVSEPKSKKVLPEKIYTKQTVTDSMTNNFDANELLKMVDNEGYNNNSTPEKLGMLSLEESRGKFYDQYMQKRDAKLKEDWKLQKEEKEAMLKAMHESLERSKAEMRAKFSQSADLPDSTYISRSAQKIPPLQRNKDQGVDSFLVEDEMNSDYLSGDGSSRSTDSRKHLPNKVASTPKTSIAPVHNHKHSSRTRPSYANRRNPPENPLAQSVPNFSNFRNENAKPSAGHSRPTARAQAKSFSRSKSIIEESKSIMKEDQSRGSQSMRKNLNASELRDTSSVNKDIYNWAPSRTASSTHKSGAPKSFPRKENGAHPIVGITGFRAPMFANVNDDDDDFPDQQEDSPDDAKDEEYESIEENLRESDFPADSDSETPKLNHDFGNSDDPGSENGDVSFPGEAASTKFNAFAGNMHDLPGELPAPWSSRLPHLLPYANDTSDGDAFVDSPTGSPSPWNSHSLDQITDADVSRMRKKWGSTQMPFSVANASQQPRKDVTKGFKKLLKFGRKNRGADGLINDWVSASTASECDDDIEDGRDLAIGSSDDFRKSRMGYLSSYDGFVENEVFTEQEPSLGSSIPNPPANFRLREDQLTGSSIKAPRSFFSLSTFRSKGGDARLR